MKLAKFFALIATAATMFVGCEPVRNNTTVEGDITLSAETVVEVNTPIHFVVKDSNGTDVILSA